MPEDTICAPATPPVHSSLAIIRISGPDTLGAVSAIFSRPGGLQPRRAVYGSIRDGGEVLDDVVLLTYRSPASFTGEDMAEIFCHGNPIIIHRIISLLQRHGLRMAEPGEFSRRSFLNGKIDLTEAEAINHIITARSEWEIDAAIRQMHGSLKETVNGMRDRLIALRADIECGIDFTEEDIEFVSAEQALSQAEEIRKNIGDILRRCRIGERISHGIEIPIVGKPNVGKSSILNLILNSERAIVSDIPGTTRDLIRETVNFAGMQVNLIDTAGIDDTDGVIEQRGIALSHKKIETGAIVLMVIDASSGIQKPDERILERLANKRSILLANKIDLAGAGTVPALAAAAGRKVIPFSARTGEGFQVLEQVLSDMIRSEFVEHENSFVADLRIIAHLESALSRAESVKELLSRKEPAEIVAFELQELIDDLSGITGDITPDDVLDSIFSRFCIGK